MIQTPRYLSFLLVCASILLLLGTLHMSGDKVPKVLSPINPWSSSPQSDGQKGAQNIVQGTQDDAPHDTQGNSPVAAPASNKPIFGSKNHDNRPTFTDLAHKSGTDKVTTHNYGLLYDKYLAQFRDESVKMIEIGLGCGMGYGPGASYPIWTTYFPTIQLNIVEYDEECGSVWAAQNPEAVIFFGDQSSVPFLHHVGAEVTADRLVDIIVDDGGHTMDQQTTSLQELWPYLRPGGVYFAEDLQTSFMDKYGGDSTRTNLNKKTFIRWIHELVDDIMASPEGIPPKNAWSSEIASIDCMAEMCVLTKKEKGER